jgi:hypothetical protein
MLFSMTDRAKLCYADFQDCDEVPCPEAEGAYEASEMSKMQCPKALHDSDWGFNPRNLPPPGDAP